MGQIVRFGTELFSGGEVNTKPPHEIGLSEAASAVNIDPKFGEARLKLAETHERMGNIQAAS